MSARIDNLVNKLTESSDLDAAIRNHEQYMISCCGRPSEAAADLAQLRAAADNSHKAFDEMVELVRGLNIALDKLEKVIEECLI